MVALAAAAALVGAGSAGCGHSSPLSSSTSLGSGPVATAGTGTGGSPSTTFAIPPVPAPTKSLFGLTLSGVGSHFHPPTSPTFNPYSPDCHALVDPAFAGKCVIASGPAGTVAGVVEEEAGGLDTQQRQERDLVWHRHGAQWVLALVHVTEVCLDAVACGTVPGLPTLLWRDDVDRDHDPKLVFVLPTDRTGYGSELDLVEGTGRVSLVRFMGGGFAVVPAAGGLVTYVPGASEAKPADAYFDQTLIGFADAHWHVFLEQYVPYAAALAQHKGVFSDPRAIPASSAPT